MVGKKTPHDNTSLSLTSSSRRCTHEQLLTVDIQMLVARLVPESQEMILAYFAQFK